MSATDRPMCRLCHAAHGSREPHVFGKAVATPKPAPVNPKKLPTGRALKRLAKKKK